MDCNNISRNSAHTYSSWNEWNQHRKMEEEAEAGWSSNEKALTRERKAAE